MKRALVLVALGLAVIGCDSRRYDQAIGVLIDVSGTYADQRKETVNVVKREILPYMVPGDTMVVVRIDSESYDQENVEALLTLDHRPSHANAQKLAMAKKLDAFAERPVRASYTDIPGAIMLASEYLNEVGGGSSVMLIFSDMQEDLPPGTKRAMDPEAGSTPGATGSRLPAQPSGAPSWTPPSSPTTCPRSARANPAHTFCRRASSTRWCATRSMPSARIRIESTNRPCSRRVGLGLVRRTTISRRNPRGPPCSPFCRT
jgi:hypothetical protein